MRKSRFSEEQIIGMIKEQDSIHAVIKASLIDQKCVVLWYDLSVLGREIH